MNPSYKIKYEETRDTLQQTCELYRLDVSSVAYKVCPAALMLTILLIIVQKSNVLRLETDGQVKFFLIYIGIWILIFAGLEVFRRTFGKKMARTAAIGDAETAYYERVARRKTALIVEMDFYDNHFLNNTGTKQVDHPYERVVRILENNESLGLVFKTDYGPKGIYSFPKSSIKNADVNDFKNFILEACPNVKKIKQV
ncbi:MAG: YcxB family protein [Lachnospiraceae bacterium]|nr:YcxB family protein [Lachnospiraceae bacterium]